MLDTIAEVNDLVQMNNGGKAHIVALNRPHGLYYLNNGMSVYRHEFRLVKWSGDKVGNTGIGVCAKNGSEG